MPERIEPGQLWENPHYPGRVFEVTDVDLIGPDGDSYVEVRSEGAVSGISTVRFRQDFARIPPSQPTRGPRTAFDQLLDDDVLPDPPPPSEQLVSSVTVERAGGHDVVKVWNRGGLAGALTVCEGDGEAMRRRLLGGL